MIFKGPAGNWMLQNGQAPATPPPSPLINPNVNRSPGVLATNTQTDPTVAGLTLVPGLNYTEAFNPDGSLYSVTPTSTYLSSVTGNADVTQLDSLSAILSTAPTQTVGTVQPNYFLIAALIGAAYFIFKRKGR